MAAWLSAVGENFDCSACKRPLSFLCPKRDHIENSEILQRIADSPMPGKVPDIFKMENEGICPRFLLTPFSAMVAKAHSWWESGQLGLTLFTAPLWLDDAFRVLVSERSKAQMFRMKNRD